MAKFRTRLAELRERHGVSRMDLVRRADITYPTVMSWENDELTSVDADKLAALMRVFQCNMQDLLYIVDERGEFVTGH